MLPRVVARTIEIERAVIRVEDGKVVAEMPPAQGAKSRTRTTISEQVFYEELAKVDPKTSRELQALFDNVKRMGLYVEPGDNSMKLKFISDNVELNFGVFRKDGSFQNYRIASMTDRIGHLEIGEEYLTRLASLFMGGYVHKPANKFIWTVKKANNQTVSIADCLAVQDRWLEIIQDTINQLLKVQENEA